MEIRLVDPVTINVAYTVHLDVMPDSAVMLAIPAATFRLFTHFASPLCFYGSLQRWPAAPLRIFHSRISHPDIETCTLRLFPSISIHDTHLLVRQIYKSFRAPIRL